MTDSRQDRNALIVEQYAGGATLARIGDEHGITKERVRQILIRQGAVTAEDARRVRRANHAAGLSAEVDRFLGEYGIVLEEMAAAGVPRRDLEERFALLLPETSQFVVRAGMEQAGLLFNADIQEFTFSDAVIECSVWFALARDAALSPVPWAAVISAMDLQNAREIESALRKEGLDSQVVAHVLRMAHTAKLYAADNPDIGLSAKRYSQQRVEILTELGLQSRQGNAPWPPTSQTVMKRLGDGSWGDAQRRLGLTPDSRGRQRGLIIYDAEQYNRAIRDFLAWTLAVGRSATYQAYGQWVDDEERSGRHWPSAESVKLRYSNWTTAKRSATASGGAGPRRRVQRDSGPSVAALALHGAKAELEQFWLRLQQTPGSDQRSLIDGFVRSFAQEFEFRRRDWLREAVADDDDAVARQLARTDLPAKLRRLLATTPPNTETVLTDRYIDAMTDPRDSGGWLQPAAQAELDSLPAETILLYRVLRQTRNLLVHNSAEAHAGLATQLRELATVLPDFETQQQLTPRMLLGWLNAAGARRLRLLLECIPDIWRAKLIAESLAATA